VAVHVLAIGTFAMVMSEFATAGLMPQLAEGLGVSVPQVGRLVTVFACAMAFGGPALVLALGRVPPKSALLIILAVFMVGDAVAICAGNYWAMVLARIITGMASQAFFGVAVSLCVRLVDDSIRGKAIGTVMNGLMLGTLLGLPAATFIGGRLGWRFAFLATAIVAAVAGGLIVWLVPRPASSGSGGLVSGAVGPQVAVFLRPQLVLALISSSLIIGATFAVFSFFAPTLTQVSGFSLGTVPWLLLAYGAATVVGNAVVGRLADRRTIATLLVGTALNAFFLTGFALWTDVPWAAVFFMIAIGFVGVTMNPAMIVRVQRAGNTSPLVNTVHTSFITAGVIVASSAGSYLIEDHGLRSPPVLGIILALAAIIAILPALRHPHLRSGVLPTAQQATWEAATRPAARLRDGGKSTLEAADGDYANCR
jgi:predicted MFS family arabinose efflux permease